MVGTRPACGMPATRCAGDLTGLPASLRSGRTAHSPSHLAQAASGAGAGADLRDVQRRSLPVTPPRTTMRLDKTGNNPARHPNCPPGSGTHLSLHLAIDVTDDARHCRIPGVPEAHESAAPETLTRPASFHILPEFSAQG